MDCARFSGMVPYGSSKSTTILSNRPQTADQPLAQFLHVAKFDDRIILNVKMNIGTLSGNIDWSLANPMRIPCLEKDVGAFMGEINNYELCLPY